MRSHKTTLQIKTKKFYDVIDLTDKSSKFLKEIKARNGLLNIFTCHTTVAIKINEKEDGFFKDLKKTMFQDIVDPARAYHHNDFDTRDPATICGNGTGSECKNGHSHIAQMLLGSASETVPVDEGKMMLGTWQRILLFELDRPRDRKIILSFIGECQ